MSKARRVAGGDILRTGPASKVRGTTDGSKSAQSAVSGSKPTLRRKPRETAQAYLLPEEIPANVEAIDVDKRGRVKMIVYRRDTK